MEGESAFGYLNAFRLGRAGSPLPAERFADGAHRSDAPYLTLVQAQRSRCGPGSRRGSESFR
jgi:hypothetical protein